jgi:exodeoxyribonuclease V alpha subunit
LSDEHLAHFRARFHVECVDGAHFFYLQETYNAEQIVMRYVSERLTLPEHKVDLAWLPAFLSEEAASLSAKIAEFDADTFTAERDRLMRGALTQQFYCVSGRPGSGKSQAVSALLKHFDKRGERTLVLAPTGKAALRLNQETAKFKPGDKITAKFEDGDWYPGEIGKVLPDGRYKIEFDGDVSIVAERDITALEDASWEAQTVDRWIYRAGLADYLADSADLNAMKRSGQFEPVDTVVIDETSMVDLFHLALLFRALEIHQPTSIKRVILVGDENQLPPIGCGRPFQDIITHLRAEAAREQRNHVRLITNCRQQYDATVLDAAHLFVGKNRYHDELFDQLCKGGPISKFLDVRYFSDTDELQANVSNFIEDVLDKAVPSHRNRSREQAFNLLLKLYDNGYVPGGASENLEVDRVQLLSPYRGGPSGALGSAAAGYGHQ